jgi:hypothetical protein
MADKRLLRTGSTLKARWRHDQLRGTGFFPLDRGHEVNMGSIHNAIGIWLCRYVFIYTLPMPSVLRYPHPPGLPVCRRRVVRACRSCLPRGSSLPRPVVVDAYKSATPSHTTLQHQPHTLDNHLNITRSKVRTITTLSAYHRLERV